MKVINIGIIGYGCVGSGTVKVLQDNRELIARRLNGVELRIKTICDRNIKEKDTSLIDSSVKLHADAEEVLGDPEIDIVVELIGGIDQAKEIILKAFSSGKSVVTANKALLAEDGEEIFAACGDKVNLGFEAAVCGAIPVLRSVREGLSGDKIEAFYGILNGTTNYILSEIEENGRDFDEVLKEAQEKGFAERDPSSDIDGLDAAHKVVLLARMCFGVKVAFSDVDVGGISEITPLDFAYAHKLGYTIKLIGTGRMTESGHLVVSVKPTLIPAQSVLGKVSSSLNAVYVLAEKTGESMYYGRGAGDTPTGGAVVSDIVSMARDIASGNVGRVHPLGFVDLKKVPFAEKSEIFYPYYVRFVITDRPGVIADISGILKQYEINIDAVTQEPSEVKSQLPFVMTLEETTEEKMENAMREIGKLDFHRKTPFVMRMDALI